MFKILLLFIILHQCQAFPIENISISELRFLQTFYPLNPELDLLLSEKFRNVYYKLLSLYPPDHSIEISSSVSVLKSASDSGFILSEEVSFIQSCYICNDDVFQILHCIYLINPCGVRDYCRKELFSSSYKFRLNALTLLDSTGNIAEKDLIIFYRDILTSFTAHCPACEFKAYSLLFKKAADFFFSQGRKDTELFESSRIFLQKLVRNYPEIDEKMVYELQEKLH